MRWIWMLLLVVVALGMTGCATTEDEESARPWNGPRNWETGLPSGMYDRR